MLSFNLLVFVSFLLCAIISRFFWNFETKRRVKSVKRNCSETLNQYDVCCLIFRSSNKFMQININSENDFWNDDNDENDWYVFPKI